MSNLACSVRGKEVGDNRGGTEALLLGSRSNLGLGNLVSRGWGGVVCLAGKRGLTAPAG